MSRASGERGLIELIEGLPERVVGLRGKGRVTGDDYEQVLMPRVDAVLKAHDKVRLLYVLGDDFDGYSGGAMWDDAKLGMEHLRKWERIAVVTDVDWVEHAVKAFGWMIPGKVKRFDDDELDDAREWITEGLAG